MVHGPDLRGEWLKTLQVPGSAGFARVLENFTPKHGKSRQLAPLVVYRGDAPDVITVNHQRYSPTHTGGIIVPGSIGGQVGDVVFYAFDKVEDRYVTNGCVSQLLGSDMKNAAIREFVRDASSHRAPLIPMAR